MRKRNSVIDIMRGVSVLLVILLHCNIHLPIDDTLFSNRLIRYLFNSGYYGVMIFFVVSGFLITQNAVKRWGGLENIQLGEFYLIRASRIFPCLLALLIVSSLLHAMNISGFVIQHASLEQALLSALTFQINWLQAKVGYLPANWDVLWSLSIEEMFYLLFPVLCIILRRQKYLISLMLILICMGPLARTKFYSNDIWSDHSYLSCMDGIAIGCLAALFANKLRSKHLWFFMGSLLLGITFFFRKEMFEAGITSLGLNVTLLEIGIALILAATIHAQTKYFRMLRSYGRCSYEIYLTHSFIVLIAAKFFYNAHQSTWLLALIYVGIVLLAGFTGKILAVYYSEPLNRYLRNNKQKAYYGYQQS